MSLMKFQVHAIFETLPNNGSLLDIRTHVLCLVRPRTLLMVIFEILITTLKIVNNNSFRIVTDYINAMQGVIIFLLLVVFRKRVRRELARRHGRCFQKLPREWATMEDEDCEELNEDSEEMAQDNLARDEEDVQLNQPL